MKFYFLFFVIWILVITKSIAQTLLSSQLRIRSEYRNGQGIPLSKGNTSAFFTSQRTRIGITHTIERLKLFTAIQDVRVWGQDASSVNRITADQNDGLMIHEAWFEYILGDSGKLLNNLKLKAGRQELVYDDARLLGNLDWLQQARRHDAAILKYEKKSLILHFGAAFNQNSEKKSTTIYNGTPSNYQAGTNGIGTMYKSLNFLYLRQGFKTGSISVLALNDNFSRYHFTTDSTHALVLENDVWSRYTMGATQQFELKKRFKFAANQFFQMGRYRDGTKLNEYFFMLNLSYELSRELTSTIGSDLTSGNNGADMTRKNRRFDPLYGTAHKFWGFMDYFYAADGFGSNGLVDSYFKIKHASSTRSVSIDFHNFSVPNRIFSEPGFELSKRLGNEIDLIITKAFKNSFKVEIGVSSMISTKTMGVTSVKNVSDMNRFSSWGYVMIMVNPEFRFSATQNKK